MPTARCCKRPTGSIAIANPKLAPYGLAGHANAEQAGLTAQQQPRIVQGENIGQTYQFRTYPATRS